MRGQVHDPVEALAGEQGLQGRVIGHIHALKAPALGPRLLLQMAQPVLLELWAVVIVEVVDADDLIAPGQEGLGHVHADETCGTGDKKFAHGPYCPSGAGVSPAQAGAFVALVGGVTVSVHTILG